VYFLVLIALPACTETPAQTAAVMDAPEGDLTYRRGTMALRLTEGRCGFSKMAEPLEEEGIPPALAYVMIQEGRPQVRGCWVRTFSDEVLLLDMGGGESFMPLSWFKREPGV
jgi:hypothetical protein